MTDENIAKNSIKPEESREKSATPITPTQDKKPTPAATAHLLPDAEMEEEQAAQPAAYSMRPAFGESFPLPIVKRIMNNTMAEKLKDKVYDKDVAKTWTREIADEVNQQIAANSKVKRYKHVVQVMLGQELGAGATYLSRCCWDCDCDTSVTEVFSNTSLFCVCTVYGTYQY
ncbi:tctex1 domain-containing protein 2 [Drosophila innubila]|uniref:tctex1 domain-containing protein 2 n=1 Tax=Drosophila innubila TaxID=198719 RepID=UPI00148BE0D9|nr:tctex1 domain-containing protein 2 [Drosophila innubila]XP_034488257.1 tctex1 domain-containing protein 2 [Drosophila innubila]